MCKQLKVCNYLTGYSLLLTNCLLGFLCVKWNESLLYETDSSLSIIWILDIIFQLLKIENCNGHYECPLLNQYLLFSYKPDTFLFTGRLKLQWIWAKLVLFLVLFFQPQMETLPGRRFTIYLTGFPKMGNSSLRLVAFFIFIFQNKYSWYKFSQNTDFYNWIYSLIAYFLQK